MKTHALSLLSLVAVNNLALALTLPYPFSTDPCEVDSDFSKLLALFMIEDIAGGAENTGAIRGVRKHSPVSRSNTPGKILKHLCKPYSY